MPAHPLPARARLEAPPEAPGLDGRGDYSVGVFHDEHRQLPLPRRAEHACRSAPGLAGDALQPCTPLPNPVGLRPV